MTDVHGAIAGHVPDGWRLQRNSDGSIGLFAPAPKEGESPRTSECFYRHGSDAGEIIYKLLDAMLTAQPVAVPAGWAMVPVEPTPEMLRSGVSSVKKDFDDLDAGDAWAAMLAASPAAPVQAREPLTAKQAKAICKVGAVYAPDGQVSRTPLQYRRDIEAAKLAGLRGGERAHGITKEGGAA